MKARALHVNTKRLRSGERKWKLSLERDFLLSVALVVDETERSRTFLLFFVFWFDYWAFQTNSKGPERRTHDLILRSLNMRKFFSRYETKSAINWKIYLTFPSLSKIKTVSTLSQIVKWHYANLVKFKTQPNH